MQGEWEVIIEEDSMKISGDNGRDHELVQDDYFP